MIPFNDTFENKSFIQHADRFTTNSVTIESDEGQSCLKLLQATKGELMSSLQTIQIPVQKSWICRRF